MSAVSAPDVHSAAAGPAPRGGRSTPAALLRRWRAADDVTRIEVYTRASFAAIWLVGPLLVLSRRPELGQGPAQGVGPGAWLLALAAVLAQAVATGVLVDRQITGAPRTRRHLLAWLGTSALAVAVGAGTGGPDAVGWRVVVLAAAAFVGTAPLGRAGPRRYLPAALGAGLLAGVLARPPAVSWASVVALVAVVALFVAVTAQLSLWICDVVRRLARAEQDRARLAVAEERLRFARDLHDVVGRDLSAIAVTSDLVAELARRGRPEAAERAEEVRRVAQESLRQVREVVRGYRGVDLAAELDGAAALLRSAGVPCTVEVSGPLGEVPAPVREAAAWVVREGVTNVVRHAVPSRCRVSVTVGGQEVEVRVVNDGANPGTGRGTGLQGLAERLRPLGGRLSATGRDGEFTLVALLPRGGQR